VISWLLKIHTPTVSLTVGNVSQTLTLTTARTRLLKYQDKLFTFLAHDGVPWNNNNAEHAVKSFAYYRELTDGQISEEGLKDYLILLSIYQTCKYKEVSFLKFLLSRDTDIDAFRGGGSRTRIVVDIELYPEGVVSLRASRKRLGIARSAAQPSSAARQGRGRRLRGRDRGASGPCPTVLCVEAEERLVDVAARQGRPGPQCAGRDIGVDAHQFLGRHLK
jgi:hypothetical protein